MLTCVDYQHFIVSTLSGYFLLCETFEIAFSVMNKSSVSTYTIWLFDLSGIINQRIWALEKRKIDFSEDKF